MLYNQKYLPFGIEKAISISDSSVLDYCIENKIAAYAKVIEYDIPSKKYRLLLSADTYGTLENIYFNKANTAASMVGSYINVLVLSLKDEAGNLMCTIDPRFEDAKAAARSYANGTKLTGKVVTLRHTGLEPHTV